MKHIVGILILSAGIAFGQGGATSPSIGILPAERGYAELKGHLGLTDAQVDQLSRLQTAYYQSTQGIHQEMAVKQRIVYTEMSSDTPNAAVAGEAVVAIARLRTQLTAAERRVYQDAAGILTEGQKPRLQALDAARRLQVPIGQAQSLFLLEGYGFSILPAMAEGGITRMPLVP